MARALALALVLVAGLGLAAASGCDYSCPTGFTVVADESADCGYGCALAGNFLCLGQASQPIMCGGTTFKPCPAITCTASYSAAYSGPRGCAIAGSRVKAYSFGDTTYAYDFADILIDESDICSGGGEAVAKAEEYAAAYATAVAFTLSQFNAYVCSCCVGNSQAFTAVGSHAVAVAAAYAEAFAQGLASVSCGADLLAEASAIVYAVAEDTQVAIDTVYKSYTSNKGASCTKTGLQQQIQTAVAKAVACTMFNILAYYDTVNDTPYAYSCSETYAISGFGFAAQCPLDLAKCHS